MEINNEFMEKHERLVRGIVKQYAYRDFQEDLLQEGRIGLMEAAKRYDPSNGVKFESYAAWWIRKYIQEAIRSYGCVISLPSHTVCDVELERLDLDMPLYYEDGDAITVEDTVEDTCQRERMERRELVEDMVNGSGLTRREKMAVSEYFGLGKEMVSMDELAARLELKKKGVYALVERAMQKIVQKQLKNTHPCRKKRKKCV